MKGEGLIMMVGPIGSFELNGKLIKGIELMDIVTKVQSFDETVSVIRIQYDTPGGRKDVGTNIYNYLLSLKPRYKIISEQIGMVGSVGTKIWFSGDERIATDGEKFFIHNPWIPNLSGDADTILATGEELKQSENELLQFYTEQTGITPEGIAPLMKDETYFDGARAVELKFATQLQKAHKIAAYMKTETKNKFMAFLNAVETFFQSDPALNMVAELEDGTKVAFATEDLSKLDGVPVFTVGEDGAPTQVPAPDGTIKLKDGRTVTITQGVVAKVDAPDAAPAAPAVEPPPPPVTVDESGLSAKLDALILALGNQKTMEDKFNSKLETELLKIRGEIKGTHIPGAPVAVRNAELSAEWDRSFAANEHSAMRKNEPEKYKMLYYSKYGKVPNI